MSRATAVWTTILGLCAGVQAADDGERTFNVYGFLDMQVEQMAFIGEGSMYRFIGLDEDVHARLDHVNLYFDFRPNSRLRGLAEIRFLTQPHNTGAVPGVLTNITFLPANVTASDTTPPASATSTTVSDASTGGFFEWGGISIERAWIDVMFTKSLSVMMGEFITPAGIWNVDHGSPAITPIQTPYGYSFIPLFPAAQTGFVAHGALFAGPVDLTYAGYIATGRNGLSLSKLSDLAVGANIRAAVAPDDLPLKEIDVGISGYTGKLRDRTAWSSVTFTVDALNATSDSVEFGYGFSDPDNKDNWYQVDLLAREITLGADLQLSLFRGLKLQGEFLYQQLQNQLDNDAKSHTFDLYGILEYKARPTEKISLTPYAMVERMWARDATNNPASWFAGKEEWRGQVIDAFNVYTFGLNTNAFTNFTVKIEASYIDVHTTAAMEPFQDVWDMCTWNAQFVLAF